MADFSPPAEHRIQLRSGHVLGYADFGPPGAMPLLYFHGFPSCRLEAEIAAPAAAKLGFRLIAPDRPGFGLSDFQPRRTLSDWPGQVAEFADALGLERFAILGVSGGGPYAAACAVQIPERLTAVALACPLGPVIGPHLLKEMPLLNRLFFRLFRWVPQAGHFLFRLMAHRLRQSPEGVLKILTAGAPLPDQEILKRTATREILLASYREAMRRDVRGGIRELELFSRPWDLPLHPVSTPVEVWHGGGDNTVPPVLGRTLAEALGARWHFLPEEGHFSLPVRHMESILLALSSQNSGDSPFETSAGQSVREFSQGESP